MSRELPCKVTICQCILGNTQMYEMLYSTSEMGVADIIPVMSKRMLENAEHHPNDLVLHRWQVRAKVYMRNSLRDVYPIVHPAVTFEEAVSMVKDYDVAILAYENETDPECTRKAMEACKDAKNVIIFIGPENGFAPEEVELAKANDVRIVTLGKRIIRAVNAGSVLMSMLVYSLELNG